MNRIRIFRFFTNGVSNSHVIYETKNGDYYGFGANSDKQLGLIRGNIEEPNKVFQEFKGRVKKFCPGHQHTVIFCNNGDVYTIGRNSEGQLAMGNFRPMKFSNPKFVTHFRKMKERVRNVEVGYHHCFFELDDCFYRNQKGQLGVDSSGNKAIPLKVKINKNEVNEIKLGGNYSLALMKNGDLWKCGKCNYYCSQEKEFKKFTKIVGFRNITRFFPGCYHLIAIDSSNVVFGYGYNSLKRLSKNIGSFENVSSISTPKRIGLIDGSRVKDIKNGDDMSIVLMNSGQVLGMGGRNMLCWGKYSKNLKEDPPNSGVYSLMDISHNICQIEVSRICTFVIDVHGRVFVGGRNNNNLGLGNGFKDSHIKNGENWSGSLVFNSLIRNIMKEEIELPQFRKNLIHSLNDPKQTKFLNCFLKFSK